jgi:hypothetical protein
MPQGPNICEHRVASLPVVAGAGGGVDLLAFAVVLVLFALVRGTGQYREKHAAAVPPCPCLPYPAAWMRSPVKADASGVGWSPGLARRAVAALRVAGAVALGRGVIQDFADRDAVEREGQITVRTGWIRPQRVLISSSVTSRVIASHLDNGHRLRARTRARLESISEALATFNSASYGRQGKFDALSLDAAVESGSEVIRGLRASARWPIRTADAVVRSFTGF